MSIIIKSIAVSPPAAITRNFLPYVRKLDSRSLDTIDLIVIHCTELPDLAEARIFGERIHYKDSLTGNSGHYYIGRNGMIEQWVPMNRVAHHVKNFNEKSLGIELVNSGRYPNWFDSGNQVMTEPYPEAQILSLIALLNNLEERLPALQRISAHSSLDKTRLPASDRPELLICRKQDPGLLFPWQQVLSRVRLEWYEPTQDQGSGQ